MTIEDQDPRTFEERAQFDRRLQSENEWIDAARYSVTIGRCLRPLTKSIVSVMHTGSFQSIRPSVGVWTLHGLGTENSRLPGFCNDFWFSKISQ